MALIDRIQKDLVDAMKAKEELRLSVLRMVKTALKNKEIEKIRPLDDAESLQILQTLVKQRKESITQFELGGRADLVAKEQAELAVLQVYLPAQMSEAEIDALDRVVIVAHSGGYQAAASVLEFNTVLRVQLSAESTIAATDADPSSPLPRLIFQAA